MNCFTLSLRLGQVTATLTAEPVPLNLSTERGTPPRLPVLNSNLRRGGGRAPIGHPKT